MRSSYDKSGACLNKGSISAPLTSIKAAWTWIPRIQT